MPAETASLIERIRHLEERLDDRENMLDAIQRGDIDALVVRQSEGYRLHTLQSADHPYQALIEQIRVGTVALREDGTMLYGNRHLAGMLGITQEHMIGEKLQPFILPEDAAILARMLNEAKRVDTRGELTVCSADGKLTTVHLSLNFLRNDDDAAVLCGVLTDLTEQKHHLRELALANARLLEEIAGREKVEEVLHHAQKLEAIGRLAAGVAHDFNNILQSNVGALEMVLDDVEEGTPAHEFATIALNAAMRGASLTHHLLSYARKQLLRPQTVALAPFLADMQKLLARTLGPHIAIEVSADHAALVLVDGGQLQTALLNLAINASHAMPQTGKLTMQTRAETEGGQKWVAIAVTDTGIGMDQATLAQAAEPFFTTKGLDGTGLGLSMVHGFAEQSGGRFSITSVPGEGTTVTLRLPAAAPGEIHQPPRVGVGRQAAGRILLVDDAPDVLLTTGAFLEKAGFEVVLADDGAQALAFVAGGERFDALISDHAMPGLNGAELLAEARIFQPGLPGVIITGFAGGNYADSVPAGTPVLHKPFHRAELVAALRRVLARE